MSAGRRPYSPPTIRRHEVGLANRFTTPRGRGVVDSIDGQAVEDLVREHGSPLFVFSERTLRERAQGARAAFAARWPRTRFAWSYKTNYLDAICSLFHQAGWYAEVVSAAEYAMARRLGVPGRCIVFNGAYKPAAALRQAADDRAYVQIDHFDELGLLEEQTAGRPTPLPVGIRVNMELQTLGVSWDRFGFNLENGEAQEAVNLLRRSRSLRLVGLHSHIGTYVHLPASYREATERLVDFGKRIEEQLGYPLEAYNLGGGFPSQSTLHTSYGPAADHVPPLDDFAEAITGVLRREFGDRDPKPLLLLESGRALVDDAGTLITTVVGTRRLPGAGRGLVLDAGVNLLYTSSWYRHDVFPATEIDGEVEPTTLYGPLCMAIDILRRGLQLPPLQTGQRLVIRPVGAYNVTQWQQFSQMRPAVVLITVDGRVEVIRRAETIEDLKTVERLPAGLAFDLGDGSDLPGGD